MPCAQVLVLDDDPGFQRLFREMLTRDGYRCWLASTPEEALEAVEADEFCLAVLDLRLPGRSGAEVAWEMRRRGVNIPIIAVSAYLDRWNVDDLADLGVDKVLSKPFTPDEFSKAVAGAIGASGRPSQFEIGLEDENASGHGPPCRRLGEEELPDGNQPRGYR